MDAEALLARSYPGGNCQIVFGASTEAVPGSGAPVGGDATICLGGDSNDWQKSSSALADQSEAILAAESSPQVPIGGEDHIVLGGAAPSLGAEELLARASPGGKCSIVFGASEVRQTTGAAVGGDATICLGNHVSDWKATSIASEKNHIENNSAKQELADHSPEHAAGLKDMSLPTPARNDISAAAGGRVGDLQRGQQEHVLYDYI